MMSINLARTVVLGFLALLAVGSFGASTAYGEAGPFFHHRAIGGKGEGEKVEAKSPETFSGEGGEQVMTGTIAGSGIEITAKSVQAKGILYNNALQGQAKLLQKYHEPKLVKPTLKCEVKMGENNELKVFIHLAWKWNGTTKQLEEPSQGNQKPTGVGVPNEIASGSERLPEGSFTTITLSGTGCGVLSGSFKINGSISAFPKPANVEEWSKKVAVVFPGWKQMHFWNGKTFIGVETGLTFAGNPASYNGQSEVSTAAQEIAVFEK
jgi:hypothetical protein